MNLTSIPAFQDNYIWVLYNSTGECLVVDPGDARPVIDSVKKFGWKPVAILLTHHHDDHTGGVADLRAIWPELVVYGPEETSSKGTTHILADGDKFTLLGLDFEVIFTPGHTLGHICYYSSPYLFCGDTLFSGGCGRIFEGTPTQMYQSLKTLNQLPANTLVCCAHEYTQSNINFSLSILPKDEALVKYSNEVNELRKKSHSSLPSTLENERRINLFLRTDDTVLIEKIRDETTLQQPEQYFAWLRAKKDNF
ncbi:hydroxyacylglutathione hydrolase [Mangrovibacter yixingensis]|uniref:hydroxyacylglutathione hydrolase n=1 Tax=Mangrovibacter yixingensis TaxID=1529639 RepID=UPI001CFB97B4|nr:hydroxyacylglutathione hydrolase [Mangrovibacter yixingensis]